MPAAGIGSDSNSRTIKSLWPTTGPPFEESGPEQRGEEPHCTTDAPLPSHQKSGRDDCRQIPSAQVAPGAASCCGCGSGAGKDGAPPPPPRICPFKGLRDKYLSNVWLSRLPSIGGLQYLLNKGVSAVVGGGQGQGRPLEAGSRISKISRDEARSGHEASYIQSSKSQRWDCSGAERDGLQDQRVTGRKNKVLDIALSYTNRDLACWFVFRELWWEEELNTKTRRNPPNENRVGWGTPGSYLGHPPRRPANRLCQSG